MAQEKLASCELLLILAAAQILAIDAFADSPLENNPEFACKRVELTPKQPRVQITNVAQVINFGPGAAAIRTPADSTFNTIVEVGNSGGIVLSGDARNHYFVQLVDANHNTRIEICITKSLLKYMK